MQTKVSEVLTKEKLFPANHHNPINREINKWEIPSEGRSPKVENKKMAKLFVIITEAVFPSKTLITGITKNHTLWFETKSPGSCFSLLTFFSIGTYMSYLSF